MAAPLDPRDPRNRDDDPPQRSVGPVRDDPPGHQDQQEPQRPEHPSSLPAQDLDEYGPVAPEPAWERPQRQFNRERFLLHCFALALMAQYGILTTGVFMCYSSGARRERAGLPPLPAETVKNCTDIGTRLEETFQISLSTILALLGGGAIAVGEYQRRQAVRGPEQRR